MWQHWEAVGGWGGREIGIRWVERVRVGLQEGSSLVFKIHYLPDPTGFHLFLTLCLNKNKLDDWCLSSFGTLSYIWFNVPAAFLEVSRPVSWWYSYFPTPPMLQSKVFVTRPGWSLEGEMMQNTIEMREESEVLEHALSSSICNKYCLGVWRNLSA